MNGERAFEIILDRLLDSHETISRQRERDASASGEVSRAQAEEKRARRELEQARTLIKDQGALAARLTTLWRAADAIRRFVPAATDPLAVAPLAALDAALKETDGDIEIPF